MLRSCGVGNLRLLVAAGALLALAACAKLVGLEDSVPAGSDGAPAATGVRISPDSLGLEASCGVAAEARYISLQNDGAEAVDYELRAPEGSRIALRDAPAGTTSLTGTLPPGGVSLVYVEITPGPPGSFDGEIFARVGDRVQPVPVHAVLHGGALSLSPAIIDFGEVRQQVASQEQTFEVTNVGNEPVNVLGFTPDEPATSEASDDFTIKAGSVSLPPGEKASLWAKVSPGPMGPTISAKFVPTTERPTCSTPPELTLKAKRVNDPVTVNPGVLDFGEADCNSSPETTRTLTVTSFEAKVHVTVSLTSGASSWFKLTSAPEFDLEQSTSADVTVALQPLQAVPSDHTETITFQIGAGSTKSVTLKVTTVGAVLAISPTTLSFSPLSLDKDFTVTNTGNKEIGVRYKSSSDDFRVTSNATIPPGQGVSATVLFLGRSGDTFEADITTSRDSSATTTLCAVPPIVHVTGKRF